MDYERIGQRIKEKRKSLKISQTQMAKDLNFSYQHLSNIERGTAGISLELLVKVSDRLQVSIDYLLQDSLKRPYYTEDYLLLSNFEDYLKHQQMELFEIQRLIYRSKPQK